MAFNNKENIKATEGQTGSNSGDGCGSVFQDNGRVERNEIKDEIRHAIKLMNDCVSIMNKLSIFLWNEYGIKCDISIENIDDASKDSVTNPIKIRYYLEITDDTWKLYEEKLYEEWLL
jgi:hypothetical protein